MLCRIDTPAPSQKVPKADKSDQKYTDLPGSPRDGIHGGSIAAGGCCGHHDG